MFYGGKTQVGSATLNSLYAIIVDMILLHIA